MMKLKRKSIMIVFGSGGHTTEMLMMLGKTNIFEKYGHVHFVIGHSDTWSLNKVTDYFQKTLQIDINQEVKQKRLTIHRLFRAREVKQSYLTSVFTTLYAMFDSLRLLVVLQVFSPVDLVLTNGPGTAVPLCYIYFGLTRLMMFNMNSKILFIESFCRVQELSLTAKLLSPIIGRFLV